MNKLYDESTIQEKVSTLLQEITGTDQVRKDLDLPLFTNNILDSLGLIQLIVELSKAFAIEITPAEIDREQWSTPRKIIENIKNRVQHA